MLSLVAKRSNPFQPFTVPTYCHCEPDEGRRGNLNQPSTMPTFAFPLLSLAIYLLSCSTWIFGQWSQGWIKTKDKSMDLPL